MSRSASGAVRSRWLSLLVAGIGVGFAAAGFHRGFSWHELAVPIGCVVAVPTASTALIAFLMRDRRWLGLAQAVTSAVLWLVVGAATVFRADVRASGLWDAVPSVLRGTANGWTVLTQVTLPAPEQPRLLALPFVLTWIAATVSAATVLRSGRAVVPAIPALALFAAAVAITVPGQGSDTVPAAGLATTVLILFVVRDRPGRGPRAAARRLAVATAYAVVLTVAACFATSALAAHTGRAPADPRRLERTYFASDAQYDLLQQLAAWQSGPNVPLFTVRTDDPGYLSLAVLDRFDGDIWTSDARFTLAGGAIPAAAGQAVPPSVSLEQFTIQGLTGYYLPEANRPTRLRGADLAVDLDSGTVASTAGLSPGLSYSVVSAPAPADGSAPSRTPSAEAVAATVAEPVPLAQVPTPIRRLVATATAAAHDPQNPYSVLRYLQTYLPAHYGIDPGAPGGTAAADLDEVLTGSQHADPGQLAAIFALAARALGLPSRLVVGFQPPADTSATGSTEVTVTANEATAWPEVEFAGVGWVPFHLTGHRVEAADNPPLVKVTSTPITQPSKPVPSPAFSVLPPLHVPSSAPGISGFFITAWTALGVLVVYLLCVLGLPGLLRRYRRKRGSRERQVVQAWLDVLDTVRLSGREVPASATTRGIVRLALAAGSRRDRRRRPRPDSEAESLLSGLVWLGVRADAIAFDAATCDVRDARLAWIAADRARRAAHRAAPLPRRAAMSIGPGRITRSLLPRRRSSRSGSGRAGAR